MNLFKIKQSVRILFRLCKFVLIVLIVRNVRIYSDFVYCVNFVRIVRIVRIVRKVVLIFAHKKNITNNKAMCGSFVQIFCSF